MNLGFDGDLAMVASAAAGLTKFVLYPLVQLRRRLDLDLDGSPDDKAEGTFFIHPQLHGVLVLIVLMLAGFAFAAITGAPLFPVLYSCSTGWAGARAAHETVKGLRDD